MAKTCLEVVTAAAKGDEETAKYALEHEQEIREAVILSGTTDDIESVVARRVQEEAATAKLNAARIRKAAAQTIVARRELRADLKFLKDQNVKPSTAVQTIFTGKNRGFAKSRESVAKREHAWENKLISNAIWGRIQGERPQVRRLMNNRAFDTDVTRELYELNAGGTPGITKNSDAQFVAKVLRSSLEIGRSKLESLGAIVGRSEDYWGPQIHDPHSMTRAGPTLWVRDVKSLLDLDRSLPNVVSKNVDGVLEEMYRTIISGVPSRPLSALGGERITPKDLTSRFGLSHALYFKNADAALAYRDKYGYGSTISLILSHQRSVARWIAAMDRFGVHVEPTIKQMLADERASLRDKLSGETDPKLIQEIDTEIKALDISRWQYEIDSLTGLDQVPANVRAAKINKNIRVALGAARLGKAVFLAGPSDTVTRSLASHARGSGFLSGMVRSLGATFRNMGSAKAREYSYLIGEGTDGIVGDIANPLAAEDGPPGWFSHLAHIYYKLNLLTGWTDNARGSEGRIVAAHLGYNVDKSFEKLDIDHQHVLLMHGIDGKKWDVLRQAGTTFDNGNRYLMPDSVRLLTDDQIKPLVSGKVTPEKLARVRENLEMDLYGYYADEVSQGVIEMDRVGRRYTTWGTKAGTRAGEAIRYVTQFKGFPAVYTQRVLGRAFQGGRLATPDQRFISKLPEPVQRIANNLPHIGYLLAGMTMAGYVSLAMKDAVSGKWPPRDPTNPWVWGEAMVQGGSLGLYGDILFAHHYFYGQGAAEILGGPGIGVATDLYKIYQDLRDGDPKAGRYLDLAIQNTPFANLFYLRPVLDVLFLNAMKEWMSPGYLARRRSRNRTLYGQEYNYPETLEDLQ